MSLTDSDKIGDILRQMGVLSSVDITRILLEQQRTGAAFGEVAMAWKLATAEQVCEAWARQLVEEQRHVDLNQFEMDDEALGVLTAEQAHRFRAVPLRRWGGHLVVALVSISMDGQVLEDIARAAGLRYVYPCFCTPEQLDRCLKDYYPGGSAAPAGAGGLAVGG